MMFYGSASKGFRVGGVNLSVPELLCGAELESLQITNDDIVSFDSDSLWNSSLA